jgi:hypothetical protein
MTTLLKLKIWEKGANQHVSLPDYRIDIDEGDSDMLRELIDAIRGDKKEE